MSLVTEAVRYLLPAALALQSGQYKDIPLPVQEPTKCSPGWYSPLPQQEVIVKAFEDINVVFTPSESVPNALDFYHRGNRGQDVTIRLGVSLPPPGGMLLLDTPFSNPLRGALFIHLTVYVVNCGDGQFYYYADWILKQQSIDADPNFVA